MQSTSRSFGLLLALASSALLLGGCSSDAADEAAPQTPPALVTTGDDVASPVADDTGAAADALAKDAVPGIRGCSGVYACVRWSGSTIQREIELRAVDGECWADSTRLLPDGKTGGDMTYAFWRADDGGFTIDRGGPDMEKCVTKDGSSKSGPKLTAPHCQGEPAAECKETTGATCGTRPGCIWNGACQTGRGCHTRLDPTKCAEMPGCSWK